jgi:2-oxoisovalerate dehydrogenase E1 component
MRDLHAAKDGLWMTRYPAPDRRVGFGEVGVHGGGTDLALVTFGNGHYLCHKALPQLRAAGIDPRIIDLRWLSPLPERSLLAALGDVPNILVVDETRRSGGLAEGLMARDG